MTRRMQLQLALTLTVLAIGACGETTAPTTPGAAGDEFPAAPSFAAVVNSWTTKADLRTPRWGLTAGVVKSSSGSILYAIGGVIGGFGPSDPSQSVNTVEAYDFSTNTWAGKAPLPAPLFRTNGVGVIGGKLYVSGGLSLPAGDDLLAARYTNALYVYDPATNRWSKKANMPRHLARGITGVIGGKLYVLNGVCSTHRCTSPRLYRYDPATNTWDTSLRSAPEQHIDGAGGVIDGKFYVVGGRGDRGTGRTGNDRVHMYDPATNRWTAKTSLPTARTEMAGVVMGAKLYILGGTESENGQHVNTVDVYDPVTDTWTLAVSMPTARSSLAAGRIFVSGLPKILAIGGVGGPGAREANEAYTP